MTKFRIKALVFSFIFVFVTAFSLTLSQAAYETDEQLIAYMNEYNAQQEAISEEAGKETPDSEAIAKMQGRIDELYKLIVTSDTFNNMSEAQMAVNELMESVNNIITFNITGELPSCTHDCSSCGGSCGH